MKKRRGHNEGSVYKRSDGRWVAMLDLGYVGGKRRRRALYAATQAEVVATLNAAAHATRRGVAVPLDRQTFGAFVERWLAVVRPSLRESTARRYGELLRHAVRALGRTSLAKLQPGDLQRLLLWGGPLYDDRRKAGAAPRSVLHLHRVIHRAPEGRRALGRCRGERGTARGRAEGHQVADAGADGGRGALSSRRRARDAGSAEIL